MTKNLSPRKDADGVTWLSVEGVAEHLGVSTVSVHRWLKLKKVPAYRLGKLWRFNRNEIDLWVMNKKGKR